MKCPACKGKKTKLFDHDIISIGRDVKRKWERVVNGQQDDHGVDDCAYCLNFYNTNNADDVYSWWKASTDKHGEPPTISIMQKMFDEISARADKDYVIVGNICSGCPIEYFTNAIRCKETPYYAFNKAWPNTYQYLSESIRMKQFVDEIFIKSLLFIDWRKYYEMPSLQKQED